MEEKRFLDRLDKLQENDEKCHRIRRAKDAALHRILTKYYFEKYTEYHEELVKEIDDEESEEILGWMKNAYADKDTKIYMVTINPKDGTEIEVFMKKLLKASKKKYIKEYMYAIEWRDEFNGMHAHMRFSMNKKKKPSEIRREFYNTFKSMVGNRKHIDVKYSYKKDAFINYVCGVKNGKPKKNRENDIKLRKKHGITDLYHNLEKLE